MRTQIRNTCLCVTACLTGHRQARRQVGTLMAGAVMVLLVFVSSSRAQELNGNEILKKE